MSPRQRIDDFLARKRIAVIGVSRGTNDFTRVLFREFAGRGYDVAPVNPNATEIDGRPCFASVKAVDPPAEAALVLTPGETAAGVVRECHEAGIRRIWLYRAVGQGAASPAAVEFCEANGIPVVAGECPFMFFPNNGFHGLHAFVWKILGKYPK